MDDFGLTFTPTASNAERSQSNGAASNNVQEAIRTLSLRIPKFGGAQNFSPLTGTGSGMTGTPQMGLEQLLARLFGRQGQQQGQPGGGSFGGFGGNSQPAPSVTPGLLDPQRTGGGPPENPFDLQPAPAPPLTTPPAAPVRSSAMRDKYDGMTTRPVLDRF